MNITFQTEYNHWWTVVGISEACTEWRMYAERKPLSEDPTPSDKMLAIGTGSTYTLAYAALKAAATGRDAQRVQNGWNG